MAKYHPIGFSLPDGMMFYIGNFVGLYSRLEASTNDAIRILMEVDGRKAATVTHNMSLPDKLAAIRALGALATIRSRNAKQATQFHRAEKWLGIIESELIPARNRIVHDIWLSPSAESAESSVRMRPQSQVKKPQSRERTITFTDQTDVTVASLQELCDLTNQAAYAVGVMGHAIMTSSAEVPLAPSRGKRDK